MEYYDSGNKKRVRSADDYTAEQYIKDCERCADQDYIDVLNTGEVILYDLD